MKGLAFVRYRLPAVLWSLALLIASTSLFSSQKTGGGLAELLSRLFGLTPSFTFLEVANVIIRKLAHLVAYGIEGLLMLRAVRNGRSELTQKWIVVALAWTLLVAMIDETNQAFDATRTGSAADVLLDMIGAFLATEIVRRRARH